MVSSTKMDLDLTDSSDECVDISKFLSIKYDEKTTETYVRIPFAFVYILIFIAALSGNVLVVASVWRHRTLQTVRNFFIVSLSCSDMVVCLTSLPITPLTFMLKNWIFGTFLCYAFPLIQGMSVCISTFTLTAVAIDRYILIIFPTRRPIQRTQAVIIIGAIWALAAGVSLPMVVHYNHFYGPEKPMPLEEATVSPNSSLNASGIPFCGYFCEESWPSDDVKQIYGTFVLILQFLIPLTVISICYAHICVRLDARDGIKRASARRRRSNQSESRLSQGTPDVSGGLNSCTPTTMVTSPTVIENRRKAVLKKRKRTNRMLIAMVVIFGICWAPQVLMNILRDWGALPAFMNEQMYFYSLVFHSVAMSCTIWNPILYSWMNETFRRSFLELLPCLGNLKRKLSSKKKILGYRGSSQSCNTHDLDSTYFPDTADSNMTEHKHTVIRNKSADFLSTDSKKEARPLLNDADEKSALNIGNGLNIITRNHESLTRL